MTTLCAQPDVATFERLYLDVSVTELSFDPAGSTIALLVGASSYPMAWVGVSSLEPGGLTWAQWARTTAMFIGSGVVPALGDVQLAAGRYVATPVITLLDGQVLALDPSPLTIR